jgi:biopolymer transport protein ExbD
MVDEQQLKSSLHAAVHGSRAPLTLVIQADKSVTYEQLLHLTLLARSPGIGITNILLATLPTATDASATQ